MYNGCESDTDCYSGEQCNESTNTSESYGCRSTQLTVKSEIFCNIPTGTCVQELSIGALCVALMISISTNQQMVCVIYR